MRRRKSEVRQTDAEKVLVPVHFLVPVTPETGTMVYLLHCSYVCQKFPFAYDHLYLGFCPPQPNSDKYI